MTYRIMRKSWYTWKIFILCSDDDPQLEEYKNKYWEEVIVFNKDEVFERIDTVDNFKKLWSPIYARNKIREVAESLWYKYFIMADDDYWEFSYRVQQGEVLRAIHMKNLDKVFNKFFEYLDNAKAISWLAFWQGGDYLWWISNAMVKNPKRKLMNLYFLDVERKFEFKWTFNDDVNTYLYHGNRWLVFITPQVASIRQTETQQQAWWITELYIEYWTYVKSFYSVIINPSCVKISSVWEKHKRIHHKIISQKAWPMILEEKFKK